MTMTRDEQNRISKTWAGRRYRLMRRLTFAESRWASRRFQRRHAVKGCVAARHGYCSGPVRHGSCATCGALTCERTMAVNPDTLRRQKVYVCSARCRNGLDDSAARERRTDLDWAVGLPDQFPGVTRTLVKDFLDSADRERILGAGSGVEASMVNQSLASLGLSRRAYAEIRGHDVVLRRLNDGFAPERPA